MQDPGVEKLLAFGFKAVAGIERNGVQLGRELRLLHAASSRQLDERLEDGAADAATAPRFGDRHAADTTVRAQATGADRHAGRIAGENMPTVGIDAVPFFLGRDVLLDDEDGLPHLAQCVVRRVEIDALDRELHASLQPQSTRPRAIVYRQTEPLPTGPFFF